MKYLDWNEEKNALLKQERDISFEEIQIAIEEGQLLDVIDHPNKSKYPIFVVNINNYVYLVPFVEDDERFFLKTIYPSRKMTEKYIIRKEKP